MEDDVMLGRMNGAGKRGRPRQRWVDTLKGYASGTTISNMRRYARYRRDGEELPPLSPVVGCDSTALEYLYTFRVTPTHDLNAILYPPSSENTVGCIAV